MNNELKFYVRKRADLDPDYPWFYSVPRGDDTYDYGSVETFDRVIECVDEAIRLRNGKA